MMEDVIQNPVTRENEANAAESRRAMNLLDLLQDGNAVAAHQENRSGSISRVEFEDKKIPADYNIARGSVETDKFNQEVVDLKDFQYRQNSDGSIVTRADGDTFIVGSDNSLTILRAAGTVENYQPQVLRYKDGGSEEMIYPEAAGFNLLRKHRINLDSGVEIRANQHSFQTYSDQTGATFLYENLSSKLRLCPGVIDMKPLWKENAL